MLPVCRGMFMRMVVPVAIMPVRMCMMMIMQPCMLLHV